MAWHGFASLGMAWQGMAWLGMAWHGMAWLGLAWHADLENLPLRTAFLRLMQAVLEPITEVLYKPRTDADNGHNNADKCSGHNNADSGHKRRNRRDYVSHSEAHCALCSS